MQALGSNRTLKDKKLFIQADKLFFHVANLIQGVPEVSAMFEPKKSGLTERKIETFYAQNAIVLRGLDEVRTYILRHLDIIHLPSLLKQLPLGAVVLISLEDV